MASLQLAAQPVPQVGPPQGRHSGPSAESQVTAAPPELLVYLPQSINS